MTIQRPVICFEDFTNYSHRSVSARIKMAAEEKQIIRVSEDVLLEVLFINQHHDAILAAADESIALSGLYTYVDGTRRLLKNAVNLVLMKHNKPIYLIRRYSPTGEEKPVAQQVEDTPKPHILDLSDFLTQSVASPAFRLKKLVEKNQAIRISDGRLLRVMPITDNLDQVLSSATKVLPLSTLSGNSDHVRRVINGAANVVFQHYGKPLYHVREYSPTGLYSIHETLLAYMHHEGDITECPVIRDGSILILPNGAEFYIADENGPGCLYNTEPKVALHVGMASRHTESQLKAYFEQFNEILLYEDNVVKAYLIKVK